MRKLKYSIKKYRNINGLKFECYTSDPAEFKKCRSECKLNGLKYRIIDSEFYKQIK